MPAFHEVAEHCVHVEVRAAGAVEVGAEFGAFPLDEDVGQRDFVFHAEVGCPFGLHAPDVRALSALLSSTICTAT